MKSIFYLISQFTNLNIIVNDLVDSKVMILNYDEPAADIINALVIMHNLELVTNGASVVVMPSRKTAIYPEVSLVNTHSDTTAIDSTKVIQVNYEPKQGEDISLSKNDKFYTIQGDVVLTQTSEQIYPNNDIYKQLPMSLSVKDIDTRSTLFQLAEIMELDIIIDDSVDSQLSLTVNNEPAHKIFNNIVQTEGLTVFKYKDIYLISNAIE